MNARTLLRVSAPALALALAACGGGQTSDVTVDPNPVVNDRPVERGPSPEELEARRQDQAVADFEEAARLYASGSLETRPYSRIEQLLESHLDVRPDNAEAWFNIGVIRFEQDDESGAIQAWERAGEVDDTFARGMSRIGLLQLESGDLGSAIATFEACIDRSEIEPACNVNMALLYLRGEIPVPEGYDNAQDAAIERLRFALGGDGRNASAYATIARIYSEEGQIELARLVCETAVLLGIDEAALHNRLGLIALEMDDVITAYAEFRRAVQLDPDLIDAWMNIGAMALSFRDYPSAADAFERVLREQDDLEIRLSYGAALRGMDMLDDALAQYEQVLSSDPSNLGAIYNRSVLYQEALSDYEQACIGYREYLDTPGAESGSKYEDVTRRLESLYTLAVDLADFGQIEQSVVDACTR